MLPNFIFSTIVGTAAIITAIAGFVKSKDEIIRRTATDDIKVIYSEDEYMKYIKQSESVLHNTTISFPAENATEDKDKVDLYYSTVSAGSLIMKSEKYKISDVGEI